MSCVRRNLFLIIILFDETRKKERAFLFLYYGRSSSDPYELQENKQHFLNQRHNSKKLLLYGFCSKYMIFYSDCTLRAMNKIDNEYLTIESAS